MEKLKTFILNNKFNLILILFWLTVVCITMCFHELWRDEAQVWCIVRDLSFIDIFQAAKVEGHPILWYLILFPFAKSGFSVLSMQIISLLFVFAAVCILIFKSPFNKFEKTIIIFSAGFLYYLPVVARNYALIPIFILFCAHLYSKREENPFLYTFSIILLSYTHLYMLGFCLISALLFAVEEIKKSSGKIKNLLPVIILGLNFLIILFTFYKTPEYNYALNPDVRMGMSFSGVCSAISKIFTYNLFLYCDFIKNYFGIISILLFYPFLAVSLFDLFKADKKIGLICFCGISYLFLVFTKIYFNGILYQKAYLIFLILIFGFYAAGRKQIFICKSAVLSLRILLIISCFVSFFVVTEDIKYNFSGGKQIAQYIKKNLNEENTFIAAGNPFLYSSIAVYLPDKKFYNVISSSYISSYTFLNKANTGKPEFPEDAVYSIIHEDIDVSENPYFLLVFKGDNKNISSKSQREVFSIYLQR